MTTEAEAKTKICPFITARGTGFEGVPTSRCQGSACMAWQWRIEQNTVRAGKAFPIDKIVEKQSETVGYCSLIPQG